MYKIYRNSDYFDDLKTLPKNKTSGVLSRKYRITNKFNPGNREMFADSVLRDMEKENRALT